MNIDTVRQNWARRGFSCDLWTDPPGRRWDDFVHAVDELVMVLEGEVEFELEGRTWRPAAGEEIFIPARARHSVRNVGTTPSRWLYGYRQNPPKMETRSQLG